MAFVYSNWYIVIAVLVVAIIALFVLLVLMDKKDKQIINQFVSDSNAKQQAKEEELPQAKKTKTKSNK